MTGDDSYHAHCFKCKVCRNRIDELVFAKTSQGIYCMDCHNERMIKIRRHAQKKAEREKAAAAGGSASSSSRDGRRRDNGVGPSPHVVTTRPDLLQLPSSTSHAQDAPGSFKSYHTQSTPRPKEPPSYNRRRSQPYVDDAFSPPSGTKPRSAKNSPSYLTPTFPPQSQQSLSVNVAPPPDFESPKRPAFVHQSSSSSDNRLQDDRVQLSADTLSATTTTRRDKRRSINPGLMLTDNSLRSSGSPPTGSPTLSPLSATFLRQDRSPTPPTHNGRDSPRMSSPLRDTFVETSTRPLSSHSAGSNGVTETLPSSHRTTSNVSQQDEQFALPRPATTSGSAPTRPRKLSSPSINVTFPDAHAGGADAIRPRRSFDERPRMRVSSTASATYDRTRSGSTSRAPSRADVPHSVESSTDTEAEPDESSHRRSESNSSLPPALPPKSEWQTPSAVHSPTDVLSLPTSLLSPASEQDVESFHTSSQLDSGSEENDESSPVEQMSHSTFIAPALPPIRFSMNAADFSDLLSSVNGNALKSLDHFAQLEKEKEDDNEVPPTPPPSATTLQNSSVTTPASDVTVFPSSLSAAHGPSRNSDGSEMTRCVSM